MCEYFEKDDMENAFYKLETKWGQGRAKYHCEDCGHYFIQKHHLVEHNKSKKLAICEDCKKS